MRRRHQQKYPVNFYRPYGGQRPKPWLLLFLCFLLAAAALFTALEVLIGVNSRTVISGNPEIMVIFGCKVEKSGPSVLLRDRLETALDYLEEHPDTVVVATGGQGRDEHQSEARAMRDYLAGRGFSGTVLMEDRSRNTWQNVNYSLSLLDGAGYSPGKNVVLVSNGFHLLRARILWGRAGGGELSGTLAAPVSHIPSRISMFFREPFALIKSFVFDR